jgi:short-subunit dehydrogenase
MLPGAIVNEQGRNMNKADRTAETPRPAVVITGATQGIGRALAEEFARNGHTLLLVARDEKALDRTAREVAARHGVRVEITAQDLSTADGCAGIEQALERCGLYADMLVNNAGTMTAGFLQDADREQMLAQVDLNVRALLDLTLRLLPGMVARGKGRVLNVASVEGFMPVPYQAAYAATKAFVLSLSRALGYELSGSGVRVSVLAPGATDTRIHARGGSQHAYYVSLFPVMTPEDVARTAYRQFQRGKAVIVPGWLNRFYAVSQRFVHPALLLPLVGWLFRVRDEQGNVQWPRSIAARADRGEQRAKEHNFSR